MDVAHSAAPAMAGSANDNPRRGGRLPGSIMPVTKTQMDLLAEHMANGCRSVSAASRAMGIRQSTGDRLWQLIRRDLGWQAQ